MHFGNMSAASNQLREILQPSPIKRRVAPRWVQMGVKLAIKEGRIPKLNAALTSGATALEEATGVLGSTWRDHVGKFTWDGIEFLVSEPYADRINAQMLADLEAFTDALGTSYFFSANSEHFPGRTVRIVIGPTATDTNEYRKHEWASAMERLGRPVKA